MSDVLLCIDFINEIVDPNGKLAAKGYASFVAEHGTLANLATLQDETRRSGGRVIHVHLGFAADYADLAPTSPLLSGARAGAILTLDSWSTTIAAPVAPVGADLRMVKKRISPFHGTALHVALRSLAATTVTIAGVSTDIAVQSAARDAHDRDFIVKIAESSCAAATTDDHDQALANLRKFALVI